MNVIFDQLLKQPHLTFFSAVLYYARIPEYFIRIFDVGLVKNNVVDYKCYTA